MTKFEVMLLDCESGLESVFLVVAEDRASAVEGALAALRERGE